MRRRPRSFAVVLLLAALTGCAGGSLQEAPTPVGTATGDLGGVTEVRVEIGECVDLAGTEDAAAARPAECGSAEADHKVIGKAPTAEECVSDSDAVYYETVVFGAGQAGALCLDVDWVPGHCFDIGGEGPRRIDCADPEGGVDIVRVDERIEDTSDEYACEEWGFPYPVRNAVVCMEDVTGPATAT